MVTLLFDELQIGLEVRDADGYIGIVTDCSDIHNIIVEFKDKSFGIYCLKKGCELYDPLFAN